MIPDVYNSIVRASRVGQATEGLPTHADYPLKKGTGSEPKLFKTTKTAFPEVPVPFFNGLLMRAGFETRAETGTTVFRRPRTRLEKLLRVFQILEDAFEVFGG